MDGRVQVTKARTVGNVRIGTVESAYSAREFESAFRRRLRGSSARFEPARGSASLVDGDTMQASFRCPKCNRSFTRKNQRHACGTGDRSTVLRNRPEQLVRLYASIEAFVNSLGPTEIVARERYVLFRSTRIFADLVIMTDAVRVAIHLSRRLDDPIYFKIVHGDRAISHVAKLRTEQDLTRIKPHLREAHEFSLIPRSPIKARLPAKRPP